MLDPLGCGTGPLLSLARLGTGTQEQNIVLFCPSSKRQALVQQGTGTQRWESKHSRRLHTCGGCYRAHPEHAAGDTQENTRRAGTATAVLGAMSGMLCPRAAPTSGLSQVQPRSRTLLLLLCSTPAVLPGSFFHFLVAGFFLLNSLTLGECPHQLQERGV